MCTYFKNDKTSSKHSQEVFWFFVLYNSYLQHKVKSLNYSFDQLGKQVIIWLAQRAVNMNRILCSDSYRSGLYGDILTVFSCKNIALFMPYNKSFIDQVYLRIMTINTPGCIAPSQPINTQKIGGQYPAILTSRMVNNPNVLQNLTPPPGNRTCVAIPPSFLSIWSANIADAALSSMLLFVP